MPKELNEEIGRQAVIRLLEKRGYAVSNLASGSGSPKYSRLLAEKPGERLTCAVKIGFAAGPAGGRISFVRNDDGSYRVLSDVDYVIHVCGDSKSSRAMRISLFDRKVVQGAFEKNYAAKVENKMSHIPLWVNPAFEPGWRLAGSGFQEQAVWSELVPLNSMTHDHVLSGEKADQPPPDSINDSATRISFMDGIRAQIAAHMGVDADMIVLEVRVKV